MDNRVCKEDQIKLIMECRQSGLFDYQWCEQNDIYPPTFYNGVSKLKKSGHTFLDSSAEEDSKPNIQEVFKVDLLGSVELGQGPFHIAGCFYL